MSHEDNRLAHEGYLVNEVDEHVLTYSVALQRKGTIRFLHLRIRCHNRLIHKRKHLSGSINHNSGKLLDFFGRKYLVRLVPACNLDGRYTMGGIDTVNTAVIIEQYRIGSR